MAQKTSRQIIIHQMYEHKNKNQAPKIIQDMELEEAKKKKKRHKPPLRTAFNWKIPLPCGPDTGNVQDTECLW